MALTTFCLLHGKWHSPACWEPLRAVLEQGGHETLAPDLPLHDGQTSHLDRAQPAIDALAGRPGAVIVGHSLAAAYAPLVADVAAPALVVYLCPAPVGPFSGEAWATRSTRPGFPFPPDGPDGRSTWEPAAARAAMYARLEPEAAERAVRELRPGASPSDHYPLDGHPPVAAALVYAADDEFFEPSWERHVAQAVLGTDAVELAGGHFPMLEDPAGLASVLTRLVP